MNHSNSQRFLKLNHKYSKLTLRNPEFPLTYKHPSSILFLNYNSNIRAYNKKLGFSSTSSNKSGDLSNRRLYDNLHIFNNRQLAFNKSIEANKKTFKYVNFSLFNNDIKTSGNKRNLRKKMIKNNTVIDYSTLFLTDKGSLLPIVNSKSLTKEIIHKQKSNSLKSRKKNGVLNKINYLIKSNQQTSKVQGNNICEKLNIFTIKKNNEFIRSIYISDLNRFLNYKFQLFTREEKLKTLKEIKKEKIDKLNLKIDSLKKGYSKLDKVFNNKFAKYMEEIFWNKESEKEIDELYIDEIIKLKNEINSLKSMIIKIKNNRNSLNHWIHLQICMKEKIISLPQSYEDILEAKEQDNNLLIKKYGDSLVKQVMNYKNNILYKNADDFLNQFNILEETNLELLNKYHLLKIQIRDFENEKNRLIKNYEFGQFNKEFNDLINNKILVLNRLKSDNINLIKYIKILTDKKFKMKNKDDNSNEIQPKIYNKTQNILSNIKISINYPLVREELNLSYKSISNQQKILINLSKIEIIIDILIQKNDSYKKLFPDKMKELKLLLDKEKKYLKNIETINNLKMKFEEERKRIIKKYEKILILPTRKININNLGNKKYLNRRNNLIKMNEKNKKIDDIYDYFS